MSQLYRLPWCLKRLLVRHAPLVHRVQSHRIQLEKRGYTVIQLHHGYPLFVRLYVPMSLSPFGKQSSKEEVHTVEEMRQRQQ